jgi:hypothetical protein
MKIPPLDDLVMVYLGIPSHVTAWWSYLVGWVVTSGLAILVGG